MTFGKHRGRPVGELPTGYLKWLLGCDDLNGPLKSAARAALARRQVKLVPFDQVLADLQDTIEFHVSEDYTISHAAAAALSDCVLDAFEEVRRRHGLEDGGELVIDPPRRQDLARPWERSA